MKQKQAAGFTLIELMIVLVIISILAAIAVPSYQNSTQKARRSDAKAALSSAVMAQEKWFFQYSGYASDVDDIGGDGAGTLLSPEGWYKITLNMNAGSGSCVGGAGVKYNCYTLTATPVADGPQAGDTTCTTLSITHIGVKSATGSNPEECW